MDNRNSDPIIPRTGGFFDQVGLRVKLILRLIKDRRVNPLLKLLPIGALLYLVIPDIAPGPIDDAAILWIGAYLFVELCPPEVVAEHRRELESIVEGEWHEVETADEDAES